MAKYTAQLKGQKVSVVSLGGKEYRESGGFIDIPDDHHAAHRDAAQSGLEKHHDTYEINTKKPVKNADGSTGEDGVDTDGSDETDGEAESETDEHGQPVAPRRGRKPKS